ncbi:Uncharacterised protein [Bordetella pertussis]|nr:Uncharacterised protein [Bordetella pertussis]CFW44642.1 Uncharacterised protein [Bordetella pertussis]
MRAAIRFRSCSTSVSLRAAGSASGARLRMRGGTTSSIRASRLAAPMATSIVAWSSSEGPIWRGMKSEWVSGARDMVFSK